jgi:hypothetical protein
MNGRNVVRRGLEPALARAALGHLRFHDLRHTAASLFISEGLNVVWVSRQLGHGSPSITLDTYAHLFAREEHAERMRSGLEAKFGSILTGGERDGEHSPESPGVPEAPPEEDEPARILEMGTRRD